MVVWSSKVEPPWERRFVPRVTGGHPLKVMVLAVRQGKSLRD